ncbi:phytanoyl-CoA dioxygenase [Histoplasma capsulatum]|uniref:Phytanoyl-CoA dioxygenase n=1 Tax=Ajellomyces capsulatus TaxID=5037 RepID=A0A8A1M3N9_AJECA|nr:phytanoyl-CoA dioxygenase [Histoplasma capsulatum]
MAAPGLEMQLQALGIIKGNLPTDPVDRANVEHCLRHGYVVLENYVTKEEVTVAKAEIDRLSGADPMKGRNTLEGLNTNSHIFTFEQDEGIRQVCNSSSCVGLERLLSGHWLQYYCVPHHPDQPRRRRSGHASRYAHEPHEGVMMPSATSHVPHAVGECDNSGLKAFDEFTADNGATRVVTGSHLWGADRRPECEESTPMVCPQGSVVYFLATTWHCGGPNNSPNPRKSLTVQYCQPYIRQIENQILAVDPRRLTEIPQRIVEMMGYRIHAPFIAYGVFLYTTPYV